MEIEIERRYLMANNPLTHYDHYADEVLMICQVYLMHEGLTKRLRLTQFLKHKFHTVGEWKLELIHKKLISLATNEEHHTTITKDEAFKLLEANAYIGTCISKTRYIHYDPKQNLKFELDSFHNMDLNILEVEIPDLHFQFIIPGFLNDEILIEVTDLRLNNQTMSKLPCNVFNIEEIKQIINTNNEITTN